VLSHFYTWFVSKDGYVYCVMNLGSCKKKEYITVCMNTSSLHLGYTLTLITSQRRNLVVYHPGRFASLNITLEKMKVVSVLCVVRCKKIKLGLSL
jgi:hypothetical protein